MMLCLEVLSRARWLGMLVVLKLNFQVLLSANLISCYAAVTGIRFSSAFNETFWTFFLLLFADRGVSFFSLDGPDVTDKDLSDFVSVNLTNICFQSVQSLFPLFSIIVHAFILFVCDFRHLVLVAPMCQIIWNP